MIELRVLSDLDAEQAYDIMAKERKLGLYFVDGVTPTLEGFKYLASCQSPWINSEFYGVYRDNELCGTVSLDDNDLHFCTFSAMDDSKVAIGREVIRQLFEMHPGVDVFTGVTPSIHRGALEYVAALGGIDIGIIKDYFKLAYGRTRDGVMSEFRRDDIQRRLNMGSAVAGILGALAAAGGTAAGISAQRKSSAAAAEQRREQQRQAARAESEASLAKAQAAGESMAQAETEAERLRRKKAITASGRESTILTTGTSTALGQ